MIFAAALSFSGSGYYFLLREEDGILSSSLYLATVLLAIVIPSFRNISAEEIKFLRSFFIFLMLCLFDRQYCRPN